MIVTVTPNPALDVTYEMDTALTAGEVHRVRAVRARAGGKGVNVASVLHSVGDDVLATGLIGGAAGRTFRADLDIRRIAHDFVDALPDVRRTVVVRDGGDATTSLWEPGYAPDSGSDAADRLRAHLRQLLPEASALVISGSLPPGIDPELPAQLAADAVAVAAGAPIVADVSGEALRSVVAAGDAVVMPNQDELAVLVGSRPENPREAAAMARELVSKHGLPALFVTLGADGLVAAFADGVVWARPPENVNGNPTGAGDAACAAVARCLAGGGTYDGAVAEALALSAASVLRPVAGEVDVDAYRRWLPAVTVEAL